MSLEYWIADYITRMKSDNETITLAEIKKSAKSRVAGLNPWRCDEKIISAMNFLEAIYWVTRIDGGEREHQHIAKWRINPTFVRLFVK